MTLATADALAAEILGRHWPYAGGTSCEGCMWRSEQGGSYSGHLVGALRAAGIVITGGAE